VLVLLLLGVRWLAANGPGRPVDTSANAVPPTAVPVRVGDMPIFRESVGSIASSNSVIFSLPDGVAQEVIKRFDAGQKLAVVAYDGKGNEFGHGFVSGVDNRFDANTGTLTCRAALEPDGDNLMLLNKFLRIRIQLDIEHGSILIPTAALHRDPEGDLVWVAIDHKSTPRRVVVGEAADGETQIRSGLSSGESVLTMSPPQNTPTRIRR
jgi:multidrug efflux pump subunit AcrA (membrane-fusion protein)